MGRIGPGNDLRVLAMLFCQEIVIDPRTYRRTLVGLFDMITPPALPYALERLNIFILLDCESKSVGEFAINIIAPSGKPFCQCPAVMAEWQSRTCECEPTFYEVVFPEAGDYLVQVSLPDRVVFERVLPVRAPAPAHIGLASGEPSSSQRADDI